MQAGPVDAVQWRATFKETKTQALRSFSKNLFDTSTGSWVDAGPAEAEDWSDLWPPQQWQIAFEILVRAKVQGNTYK